MRCPCRSTFSHPGLVSLGVDPGPGLVLCMVVPPAQVPWHLGYQSLLAYRQTAGASPPMPPPDISLHVFEIKGHFPSQVWWLSSTFHSSVGCCPQAEWCMSLPFQVPNFHYPSCCRPFPTCQLNTIAEIGSNIPINQGPRPIPTPTDHGFCGCTAIALLALLLSSPCLVVSSSETLESLSDLVVASHYLSFPLFFFLSFVFVFLPSLPSEKKDSKKEEGKLESNNG